MQKRILHIALFMLTSCVGLQAKHDVAFYINGRPVSRQAVAYAYTKSPTKNFRTFFEKYLYFQQKVQQALEQRCDTLPAYRNALILAQSKLAEAYDSHTAGQPTPLYATPRAERLPQTPCVELEVITYRIAQHATPRAEQLARQTMDAVYRDLLSGQFTSTQRILTRHPGGQLSCVRPVPQYMLPEEWITAIAPLEEGDFTPPFLSPSGLHIVRLLRRCAPQPTHRDNPTSNLRTATPCRDTEPYKLQLEEIQYALLAGYAPESQLPAMTECSETDLKRYFTLHKAQYRWDRPHFSGAVVMCKDPKTARTLKKYLDTLPPSLRATRLETLHQSDYAQMFHYIQGLFAIGSQPAVDKIVFGCGDYVTPHAFPYPFYVGKKLKTHAKNYQDIYEQVKSDYLASARAHRELQSMPHFDIVTNDEVIKTVNKIDVAKLFPYLR